MTDAILLNCKTSQEIGESKREAEIRIAIFFILFGCLLLINFKVLLISLNEANIIGALETIFLSLMLTYVVHIMSRVFKRDFGQFPWE